MSELGSKHKVLHLIDSAGLYGAEKMVVTLLENLKDTNFPGILGCIREREDEIPHIATEAAKRDVPVSYFTMQRGFSIFGIRSISRFIHNNKITIVHSHGYKPNIFLNFVFNKQIKKISTVHGWSKGTAGIKARFYEFLDRLALKRMDHLIAVSQSMIKDLIRRGFPENRMTTIYNGINLNHIFTNPPSESSLLRKEYGISNNSLAIGTMGRLVAVKGHTYLLQAMPAVLNEVPNCTLIIAGDGPLKAELEHQIKALNLIKHVKIIGYIKDINVFFSMTDMFVLPSLSEGLPITLLEAMACGKPVVASAAGGIPEILTNEISGILIPPADVNALATAIITLANDKDRMRNFSVKGRKVVENNFSANSMARNYAMIYSKLVTA